MALAHQPASLRPLAPLHRGRERQHAGILGDHVPGTPPLEGREAVPIPQPVLFSDVPERRPAEQGCRRLALPTPRGIFTVDEGMLHPAVDHQQPHRIGGERHVAEPASPTVEEHGMPRTAERDGRLVHDAAGHAGKLVLGPLAEERFVAVRQAPSCQRLDRRGDPHFERGAAAQPAPGGQVGGDRGLEARDLPAEPLEAGEHPFGIAAPIAAPWRERDVEVDRHRRPAAVARQNHPPVEPRPHRDPETPVDRDREHEAVVVVGVLADQVHPSGRPDRKLGAAQRGHSRALARSASSDRSPFSSVTWA